MRYLTPYTMIAVIPLPLANIRYVIARGNTIFKLNSVIIIEGVMHHL